MISKCSSPSQGSAAAQKAAASIFKDQPLLIFFNLALSQILLFCRKFVLSDFSAALPRKIICGSGMDY